MKDNKNNGQLNPKKFMFSFHLNTDKFNLASEDEKAQFIPTRPSTSFFKDGIKRLCKNKISMVCLAIITFIVLSIIIIPEVWPYKYEQQLGMKKQQIIVDGEIIEVAPSVDSSYGNLAPFEYGETELKEIAEGKKVFPHIFGTDGLGRDYFIRVVYGTRVSLMVGFFASIIVLIIGMIYGSVSGYLGGKIDMIMMRIVDIIYSLPDMVMIILLSVVLNKVIKIENSFLEKLGTNMISIFIVFALLYWVSMARLIRGQILTLKQQEYILAARTIGASGSRIIRKHLLPNCISIIIISTALQIPSAIFTESYLSFMGLGVSAPMPSLGSLASDALSGIYSYPYRLIIPAVVIFLLVLSFNLFGDGLRDAFDPKLKQ